MPGPDPEVTVALFETDNERRVLSVRQLNESIQAALQTAFPDPVWVKGEVQRLPADAARRKHVYFELHEGGDQGAARYQIPTALLGWDRDRFGLGRFLDGSDPTFRLQDKLEVCLLCRVDFYPPFGKISLKVVGIDPEFSLGRLEARRRQVLAWLEQEGLLALNPAVPLADLPLRVGLITSRGSAAERDFRTGLEASGYPFDVTLADCRMQGDQTAPQVTAALAHLAAQDLDVIVVTRGGGSRADLSWFDQQDLCAAVARCERPVVTAIGHEIDTSLADLCAHTRCKTPTAAAEFLVERVRGWDQRLVAAADRLAVAALARLASAHDRLDACGRVGPAAAARLSEADRRLRTVGATLEVRTGRAVGRRQQQLQRAAARLVAGVRQRTAAGRSRTDYLARQLAREGARALSAPRRRLDTAAGNIPAPALRRLRDRASRLEWLDEKVRLLDPATLLERGFTLTVDRRGRPLRRAADAHPGQELRTRFADGEITSIVTGSGGAVRRPKPGQGGRRGGEEDPGQQALF